MDPNIPNPSKPSMIEEIVRKSTQISAIIPNVWPVAEAPQAKTSKQKITPPVIKYYFRNELPEQQREDFEFARDEWMKYAYIDFQPTTTIPTESYIDITFPNRGGAQSDVGKRVRGGEPTRMSFGPNGRTRRNFLHEFGHVLGFEHEHQRPDRGSYGINICEKPRDRSWAENYFEIIDPSANKLLVASVRYPLDAANMAKGKQEIPLNQDLSTTDKAFTMLMYPGRAPADMTLDNALRAASVSGNTATNIKKHITAKNYASARSVFVTHNKTVLAKLQKIYREKKGTTTKATSKKDVGTETPINEEGDDFKDFEDFLRSGAVEEAVEWVANNESDE
ncbi:hypothetical protein AX17_004024 [Amanita inopinata Kibby_2008]|nr:hypothetical protein AX17_004024 [Amanita inopinata Kibby_2008]